MEAATASGLTVAAYTLSMTNFDQSKHPRNAAGTSAGGQFAPKQNSAPESTLVEPTFPPIEEQVWAVDARDKNALLVALAEFEEDSPEYAVVADLIDIARSKTAYEDATWLDTLDGDEPDGDPFDTLLEATRLDANDMGRDIDQVNAALDAVRDARNDEFADALLEVDKEYGGFAFLSDHGYQAGTHGEDEVFLRVDRDTSQPFIEVQAVGLDWTQVYANAIGADIDDIDPDEVAETLNDHTDQINAYLASNGIVNPGEDWTDDELTVRIPMTGKRLNTETIHAAIKDSAAWGWVTTRNSGSPLAGTERIWERDPEAFIEAAFGHAV